VAQSLISEGPAFLLAQAGHAVNSYGLSLVTCVGPVGAFVQHAYGGIYGDRAREVAEINITYARLVRYSTL
jgi:hypothetical protein